MNITNFNRRNGYSKEKFQELFGEHAGYGLLGSGLLPAFEYDKEKHKRTNNIIGRYMDMYFQGLGVQRVKFPKDFTADEIEDMTTLKLINPQACVVNNNVYVKADGVE
ncbi:hypothetical protein [Limosilactobacillus reuteri]|uniref:hypothetical protein n=1 Tax=Limosilactobacillus reuteri TaxID=1598 RepID=UPI003CFE8E26